MVALDCIDPVTKEKFLKTPSVLVNRKPKNPGEKSNITPQEDATSIRLENLGKIYAAGIRVALGSSAGIPLLLHRPATHDEMIQMAKAGLSPMDVIVASTKNGAAVIGREDIGTIEIGSIADLVLLNENPLEDIANVKNINIVIRGGEIVRSEEN